MSENVLTLAEHAGTAEHNTPERALLQAMARTEEQDIRRAVVILVAAPDEDDGETMHIHRAGDERLLVYDLHRALASDLWQAGIVPVGDE